MKFLKIDASILCFIVVMLAAVPVAALRAKTYAIGYELGRLKNTERGLRQKNVELQYELASVHRTSRERHLGKTGDQGVTLHLPAPSSVLHGKSQNHDAGE